jgi:hypothetical protein
MRPPRYRPGSRVGQAVQVIRPAVPRTGECLLLGEDAEGIVDRGEVGRGIRAGISADRPVDQGADQLGPGNALCLRNPVKGSCLALREVSYTTSFTTVTDSSG